MSHFDELNTIEQMTIDTLRQNGWTYVKAADLPRTYDSVLVEPMLRDALVRLNPCIAAEPSRADQVIYRLRSLILSARPGNLIAQNEIFKQFIFERNTFPFGKNGKAVPVRFLRWSRTSSKRIRTSSRISGFIRRKTAARNLTSCCS